MNDQDRLFGVVIQGVNSTGILHATGKMRQSYIVVAATAEAAIAAVAQDPDSLRADDDMFTVDVIDFDPTERVHLANETIMCPETMKRTFEGWLEAVARTAYDNILVVDPTKALTVQEFANTVLSLFAVGAPPKPVRPTISNAPDAPEAK